MIRSICSIVLLLITAFSAISQNSHQRSGKISKEVIERIKAFNKLYGYVKYFHPSDEAAALDWDAFAIYGVQEILNNPDKKLDDLLNQLFLPVAPSIVINGEIDWGSQFYPLSNFEYDTIQWQHLGNGDFNTINIYQSLRTNRNRVFRPSFYDKEEIILKLNTPELKKGNYQIKLRLKNKLLDNFYRIRISTCWTDSSGALVCSDGGVSYTKRWLNYAFKVDVTDSTKSMYIKVTTRGTGETLIDKIKLLNDKRKEIWSDDFTLTDLESFLNDFDSRNNQFFQCKIVDDTINRNHFLNIYPVVRKLKDSLLFKPKLAFGNSIKKNLNETLSIELPTVLLGDSMNTYPIADNNLLVKLKDSLTKINESAIFDKVNVETRLADLIVIWNTIQHFYPYHQEMDVSWDTVFDKTLNKCFHDTTYDDHLNTIEFVLSFLKDSHVTLTSNLNRKRYQIPLIMQYVKDKVIIKDILSEKLKVCVGDELLELNGKKIVDTLAKNKLLISSRNEQILNERALSKIFRFNKNEKVELKIKNSKGKIKDYTLKASLGNRSFSNQVARKVNSLKYRMISKEVFYLNLLTINYDNFIDLLPDLQSTKKIIIDMRGYPTEEGDNIIKIIGHFRRENSNVNWMFIPYVSEPDIGGLFNEFAELGREVIIQKPYLNKKIYLLIDHKAQSYAESIIGYFDVLENVTSIGTPTAGANGNVVYCNLPSGAYYRYTGMKVLKHDGSRLHGIGFLPDVEVRPTIQGIIEGRDEVLEKAIELAQKNKD